MRNAVMAVLLLAAMLVGCDPNSKPVSEAKIDAHKRWDLARARVLYGVAVEHLKVGQLKQARTKCLESLALRPDYADARLLLGKVFIEQGEYALAIEELTEVHRQLPKHAETVYLLGAAQEKAGLLDEALRNYRIAYATDSSSLAPIKAAAEVQVAMGETDAALVTLESYLDRADNDPGMFELAGRIASMLDMNGKAARYYASACDLDSDNPLYRESLAKARFHAGQYKDALVTFDDLLAMDDYSPPAWVHVMRGDCYLQLGRTRDGRDAYLAATRIDPDDPRIWANHAKAALAMQDGTRAAMSARQALRLEPGHFEATLVLGYALLRDKQADQAVDVLRHALARNGSNATLLCVLGRAHAARGEHVEAMRCYVKAVRLEPKNSVARALLNGADRSRRN